MYVLGPVSSNQMRFFKNIDGCELAPDIIYLGRAGCFRTNGLSITYMSGKDGQEEYEADIRRLKTLEVSTKCNELKFQGVDILLTTDWPKGILNNVERPSDVSEYRDKDSNMAAYLAHKLRPRYHLSGCKGIFYERLPYRNHRVVSETVRHVTRFIGLADVGNLEKKKWLYAFNIIPIIHMDPKELTAQPSAVSDMPFKSEDMRICLNDKQTQFFYSTDNNYDHPNRKRRGGNTNYEEGNKKSRPPIRPTGPCWFCLSGAEVEKHLIISIGNYSYIALPKGGLTPHHLLILPITHHSSTLELPDEVNEEIEQFKAALRKCFKKFLDNTVVFYERNYKSQHLQLQVVPIPRDVSGNVRIAFEESAEEQNLEIIEIPDHANLCQMAASGTPYFYVEMGSKLKLFHKVQKNFPLQFGREVLASKYLLNMEERTDWKECKVEKEVETKMANDFRSLFEPFDFTLVEESD